MAKIVFKKQATLFAWEILKSYKFFSTKVALFF